MNAHREGVDQLIGAVVVALVLMLAVPAWRRLALVLAVGGFAAAVLLDVVEPDLIGAGR